MNGTTASREETKNGGFKQRAKTDVARGGVCLQSACMWAGKADIPHRLIPGSAGEIASTIPSVAHEKRIFQAAKRALTLLQIDGICRKAVTAAFLVRVSVRKVKLKN